MSDVLVLNADGTPLSVVPLSVVTWQVAISLMVRGRVRCLKEHDGWVVRSPSTTMKVPSVVICTTFKKWNRLVKYNRANIYLRDDYTCQYCMKRFSLSALTLDHVVPRSHGGKTNWTNVVTACGHCNFNKGNDATIVPKIKPVKPSYYYLMAQRKKHPIVIKDHYWQTFLDWPEEKVNYKPYKTKKRS
jgi:5-methylcytosine-specific restriction endonuclease McrA